MSVFQSQSTAGRRGNSLGDACSFDFRYLIALAMHFTLEMATKKFDAKQRHMHGYKTTAPMCRFLGYMVSQRLQEKL
jgi:hypothetical protein